MNIIRSPRLYTNLRGIIVLNNEYMGGTWLGKMVRGETAFMFFGSGYGVMPYRGVSRSTLPPVGRDL